MTDDVEGREVVDVHLGAGFCVGDVFKGPENGDASAVDKVVNMSVDAQGVVEDLWEGRAAHVEGQPSAAER